MKSYASPKADSLSESVICGVKRGIYSVGPVIIGYVPFALVLGAQARAKGFSAAEVPLLTGLNFAGGSECAVIGLWTSPPHILLLVGVTLLVNSRHILMGATLAPLLGHLPLRRVLLVLAFMCDETWALSLAEANSRKIDDIEQPMSLPYYVGVAGGLYFSWIVFTTLGALVGPVLGDVTRYGFDLAFPAVFLVLLRGMWTGIRGARPWIVSGVAAGLTYSFIPGAWYVPVGTVAGMSAAWLCARG